jgi:hypothetical protein
MLAPFEIKRSLWPVAARGSSRAMAVESLSVIEDCNSIGVLEVTFNRLTKRVFKSLCRG